MKENDFVAKYEGEGGITPYLKSRSRQKEKEEKAIQFFGKKASEANAARCVRGRSQRTHKRNWLTNHNSLK
jgi:hypothetical protein